MHVMEAGMDVTWRRGLWGPLLAAATAVAGASASAARASPVGFSLEDVRGRVVDSRGLAGKVVLLAVATDATTDQVVDWQVRMGYAAAVTLGGDDRIAVVSIADVSDFSWIARPFARRRLQTIDRTAGERLRERFAADHVAPPADLAERVSLLPDWRGDVARSLVPASERDRPHLFVVGADGEVRGHFTQNTEETRREALRLLAELVEGKR